MSVLERRKLIFAFIVNLAIVGLEIVGLILSVQRHGVKVFQFYTENSNYFALIVSAIFCIGAIVALIRKTRIRKWLHILRYVSTVCLTLTLIIVLIVLIPLYPDTFAYMLFGNSNLYQHLLCPVFSLISFILLEKHESLPKKAIFYALIPTIIYGVACIILNLFKVITGPYPFLYLYAIPWYISAPSLLGILLSAVLIAFGLYALHNGRKSYVEQDIAYQNAKS